MAEYNPERWFLEELRLIDPKLKVEWNNRIHRWIIYNPDGSPSHIVQNKDKSFRPLDQRILRKLRVDIFFTHNATALEKLLDNDDYALRTYLRRGIDGLSDYLTGYWE